MLETLGHAQVFGLFCFFPAPLIQKPASSGTVEDKGGTHLGFFGERQNSMACIAPQRSAEDVMVLTSFLP